MTGRGKWISLARPLVCLCVLAASSGCGGEEARLSPARSTAVAPKTAQLVVAGRDVSVELAYTDVTRSKGLMGRTRMETDSGMLFLFEDEQPRRFWMRHTLIGLDIAFLDDAGRVLNIEHGRPAVEFPGYRSVAPARFVLEMEAGWCAEAGLKPGDLIEIPAQLRNLAEPTGAVASP